MAGFAFLFKQESLNSFLKIQYGEKELNEINGDRQRTIPFGRKWNLVCGNSTTYWKVKQNKFL